MTAAAAEATVVLGCVSCCLWLPSTKYRLGKPYCIRWCLSRLYYLWSTNATGGNNLLCLTFQCQISQARYLKYDSEICHFVFPGCYMCAVCWTLLDQLIYSSAHLSTQSVRRNLTTTQLLLFFPTYKNKVFSEITAMIATFNWLSYLDSHQNRS